MNPSRCAILAMLLAGCNLFASVEVPDVGGGDSGRSDATSDDGDAGDVGRPSDVSGPDATVDASTADAADLSDVFIPPNCGDGALDEGELCDEGAANSSAADAACRPDCRPRRCGDGVADTGSGEVCDDGNLRSHDGCSSQCLDETPTWTQLEFPTQRYQQALAFDSDRNVLVMFGGSVSETANVGDTWEFDGTSWMQKSPADSPSARHDAKMVYDTANQRVVLFGGEFSNGTRSDETWSWDGSNWTLLNPVTSPPVTDDHAMVWVEATQEIVVFGGTTQGGTRTNAVWRFDGTTWTEASSAGAVPSPRKEPAMAAIGNTLIMHGGDIAGGRETDTWRLNLNNENWTLLSTSGPEREEHFIGVIGTTPYLFGGYDGNWEATLYEWTGSAWTLVTPPAFAPAPRRDVVGAPAPGGFYIAGGARGNAIYADVWRFDGASWDLHYAAHPTARDDAAGAYYPGRGFVLYGGDDFEDDVLYDTWELPSDAGTWRRIDVPAEPGLEKANLAFDPIRNYLLMFGGRDSDQTWSFDGSWGQKPDVTPRPSARIQPAVGFDGVRGEVLLAGGCGTGASDVWSYDGARWNRINDIGPRLDCEDNIGIAPASGTVLVFWDDNGTPRTHVFDGMTWTEASPVASPPVREEGRIVFHPDRGSFLLFGGRTVDQTQFEDTWEFDGVDWHQIVTADAPSARNGHLMAYDPVRRAVVLTGGNTGSAKTIDTWLFRYEGATPDEVCDGAGLDEDGDGVVDCDDPDCASHPDCP